MHRAIFAIKDLDSDNVTFDFSRLSEISEICIVFYGRIADNQLHIIHGNSRGLAIELVEMKEVRFCKSGDLS